VHALLPRAPGRFGYYLVPAKMESMTAQSKLPIKYQAYRTFVRPYARFALFVMIVSAVVRFLDSSNRFNLLFFAELFVVLVTGFGVCALLGASTLLKREKPGRRDN
jgi:hypothetical protein